VSIDEVELTAARCRRDLVGRSSADVVLLSGSPDARRVLLIRRAKPPFAGCWALPGGHVDEGETSRAAAVRELFEECGVPIDATSLQHVGTYTGPDRDPRGQARSEAFVAVPDAEIPPTAGSDSVSTKWVDVAECASASFPLAFDHARILNDALVAVDGATHRFRIQLVEISGLADVRNMDYTAAVSDRLDRVTDTDVLLAEYAQKSNEIVERIKQRDSFINLNIVAAALIVGFAGSNPSRAAAWLALPWSSLCFGWAYLANDEKVTGLARYFQYHLGPQLGPRALGWERSPKRGTKFKKLHKAAQLIVDLLQFVAPTAAAIVAYGAIADHPWKAPMLQLVIAEAVLAVMMATLIVTHSSFVKRFDITPEEWRDV